MVDNSRWRGWDSQGRARVPFPACMPLKTRGINLLHGPTFRLLFAPTHAIHGAVRRDHLSHYRYYSFPQSPAQRRKLGARGGRACARNRRARLRALPPMEPAPPSRLPDETTAQAIGALDAQFPWLRDAEKRRPARPR
jgi:hypothetical protein